MNIPTPAAVKKLTEDRKAREAELASSLANAKDKMPSTKGKGSRVRTSDSISTKDSSPSLTQHDDKKKSGSPANSRAGSNDSPSLAPRSRKSPSSTRSAKETTSLRSDGKANASGSPTGKKQSSTKPSAGMKKSTPETKKPFVRPDHLTTKPLRDNEALQNLKDQMNAATAKAGGREVRDKPARGQFKREYRVGGRRSGKSQGLQNKKENN